MIATLFKQLPAPDRQETQLAYEASFYPQTKLHAGHKLVWSKALYLTKEYIESHILDNLFWNRDGSFVIHWEYNNIPTEQEWNRILPKFTFLAHLRISPLIKANQGRVIVLRNI